jgi:hypothetical protein
LSILNIFILEIFYFLLANSCFVWYNLFEMATDNPKFIPHLKVRDFFWEGQVKREFIDGYCQKSGIPWLELSQWLNALPCNCGDESCEGWAMVSRDQFAIKTHTELYGKEFKENTKLELDN